MQDRTLCFLLRGNPPGQVLLGFKKNGMGPVWFDVERLAYEQMWQDARHWLARILIGECLQMRFVFDQDNETVREVDEE